jgi:hypothetical protein
VIKKKKEKKKKEENLSGIKEYNLCEFVKFEEIKIIIKINNSDDPLTIQNKT